MKTIKTTKCDSGIKGWQANLQKVYSNYSEFVEYSQMYGIAKRLGFASDKQAWKVNPRIMGSVNPEDLRRV